MDTKLWPGSREGDILIKKIAEISPPLTIKDKFALQDAMNRRFYNVNRTRKAKLKIPNSKGTITHSYMK